MKDKLLYFKALSNETRLLIIEFLSKGEQCACDIVPHTKKSQPNVSLHLKKLEETGILKSRKEGTRVLYKIADPKIHKLLDLMK